MNDSNSIEGLFAKVQYYVTGNLDNEVSYTI